ncbi:MAG: autotransporter outer membrane beta-barrel domain-containing protein [Hyphomicrobium sp.]
MGISALSWAAQQAVDFQSAGMWGVLATAPANAFAFPIIAFSNSNSGPAGRFQVWDDNIGWVFVNAPVNYGGWNTLRMEFHPTDANNPQNTVDFFINGTLVYTNTAIGTDPTSYLKAVILNSYNNGSSEYDVFWANVFAGLLMQQDPAAFEVTGAVADMTKFYIYSSVGDLASRRGAEATEHFSPYDYVWAYAGGTTGQFDLSNSSGYDGTTYFLRSGIDVIQPMESLRLGLTVSAGRAQVDADSSGGSADLDSYSAGGYLTYATRELYVDVIPEYAWGEWNVSVPGNGTDKSNVSTYVASGEVGTSLYMAKGVRVVPNASLLFLNSDYDAMNFGLANVAFGGESSLIGRAGARLEYMISPAFGGSRVYAGVSAVKDLLDEDGLATVQSVALPGGQNVSFAGGFGSQTAAQFNAGLDLKVAKGTRLYGDTSYLTGGDADAFRGSGGFIVNW